MFTPSPYQLAIFNAVCTTQRNILVQACAGSGKTTTIAEACKLIPTHIKTAAVCFNKAIAEAFKLKLPSHIHSCTLHSLGFYAIQTNVVGAELDDKKLKRHLDVVCRDPEITDIEEALIRNDLTTCVSLCMSALIPPTDAEVLDEAATELGKPLELPERSFIYLPRLMEAMTKDVTRISFDDMLFHPLAWHYRLRRFDLLFVDEAQDLNPCQREFCVRSLAPGGRIIMVGDRFQSVYKFRGADPDSMDQLKTQFDAVELPLSISYRCPVSIVDLARTITTTIEAAPGAPDGQITRSDDTDDALALVTDGDLILSRTNAPLARIALRLIKHGRKATVRGRDIGKGLASFISRFADTSLQDSLARMTEYVVNTTLVHIQNDEHAQAMLLQDKADTVRVLAHGKTSLIEVLAAIDTLFSDQGTGIVCSTIHRAKGLEAPTVIVLDAHKIPHPMAVKNGNPAALQQETNLRYVAFTRASSHLILLTLPH